MQVPDPDCMNLRINNVTILIDNSSSNNTTKTFGPIETEGLEGEVLQYSINDLAKNSHFETAVIASNKFGSSVSAVTVNFCKNSIPIMFNNISANQYTTRIIQYLKMHIICISQCTIVRVRIN